MSGAGKTTVLDELRRRGHMTVDTDYDGWELYDGTWDERRMEWLLPSESEVVVSGTVESQGRFYDRFEYVVLLSAPLDVLLERVSRARTIRTETASSIRPRSRTSNGQSNHSCAGDPH